MYLWALVIAFGLAVYMTTATSGVGNASCSAATLQDWIAEGADIIFVTFSKETPIIHCSKFVTSTFTIWTGNDVKIRKLVGKNRILSRPTVIFYIVHSKQVIGLIDSFASTKDTGVLTHWIVLLNKQDFDSHAKRLEKSAIHLDVSAISDDQMSSRTFLRCKKGLTENRCSGNSGFVPMNYSSHADPGLLSGQTVRLGCLILGEYDTCNYQTSVQFMSLLSLKNVSLKLATYRSFHALFYDIYANKIDVGLVKTVLRLDSLASLSFADITFSYGSFYALDNKTRVVSLFDALCSSISGTLALLSLMFCAIVSAACTRQRSFALYFARAFNEGFLLLAPLLGISSQLPFTQRMSISHTLVYSVWIVAILPFSVYFRSTLMSLVTVRRPADVLDTLSELESGLDAGRILPCVVERSSEHADIEGTSNEGCVLLRKLRKAYRIHMRHGLLKTSVTGCLRCATEENRVCFINRFQICEVKHLFSEIGEFKEHFTVDFSVFPMPKESKLTSPFKQFMTSIREGSLNTPTAYSCNKEIHNRETTDDLFPFLANWFVLLCMSGIFLIGEVILARFYYGT